MSVRNLSELGNYSLPPKKNQRFISSSLERLRGFEFLEAVDELKEGQIKALDHSRVTFIISQLGCCLRAPASRPRAWQVAFKVMKGLEISFLEERKALCKSLMNNIDLTSVSELCQFSNELFLRGDPLFKEFYSLPYFTTYGKIYNAILKKDNFFILASLRLSIDFGARQADNFVLFDQACLNLNYEVLQAFLLKNPYITPIAYHNIIQSKHLTSNEKLDLFINLHQRGIKIDELDFIGWTPLCYAITYKQTKVFNFLIGHANIVRTIDGINYIQRAVKDDFYAGVEKLSNLLPVNVDLFRLACDSGKFRIATLIAKKICHRWENVPGKRFVLDELDPKILEKTKEAVSGSAAHAFEVTRSHPLAYSMEYLSAVRETNPEHYVDLAKRISHAWGIEIKPDDPLTGKVINSDGHHSLKSLACWLSFLKKMEDMPEASELLEELTQVYYEKTPSDEFQKIDKKIDDGKTVVCLTGYDAHATYALFKLAMMFYANRGADRINCGLSFYDAPSNGIGTVVEKAVRDKSLPQSLYFSEKDITLTLGSNLLRTIKLGRQSGPYCTINSLKAASLGLMVAKSIDLFTILDDTEWSRAVEESKSVYKILTTQYRLDVMLGLILEVEDFLIKNLPNKSPFAQFYFHALLAVSAKIEKSSHWDPAEKREYTNQIKIYLNILVGLL